MLQDLDDRVSRFSTPFILATSGCLLATAYANLVIFQHSLNSIKVIMQSWCLLIPLLSSSDGAAGEAWGGGGWDSSLVAVTIPPKQYSTSLVPASICISLPVEVHCSA